jgi:hypothetical protein
MKKPYSLLLLTVASVFTYAQSAEDFTNDNVFFDIGAEIWIPTDDALTSEVYSHNIGFTFYNQLSDEKQVTFAYGLGFSWNNTYTNLAFEANKANNRYDAFLIPDSVDYTRNKYVAAYLDVPFEMRYRSKPNEDGKFFRFYAGAKVGVRIGNYTKYITDELKVKNQRLDAASQFRVGLQGRIGYGKWALFAFVPVTNVFENDVPYEVQSMTVGLSFTP